MVDMEPVLGRSPAGGWRMKPGRLTVSSETVHGGLVGSPYAPGQGRSARMASRISAIWRVVTSRVAWE